MVRILTKNNFLGKSLAKKNILCKNILLTIRTSRLLLILSHLLPETSNFLLKTRIKILQCNLPEIFTNYFVTNKDIHNYNTRNASSLHKKYNRTNYNKHTLANKGIDVWNNLPLQYKEIRSFPIFKTAMKKYFLPS